tara:strand:- start:498 stop:995 length:498 start_codon:yes stop_codon:yes gene_type:complete
MDARSVRSGNCAILVLPMATNAKQGHRLDDSLTRKNNTHTKTDMKTNTEMTALITAMPARSAWMRGVKAYALEMVESAESELATVADLKKELLNGATNWREYSYGGCALIYDADIAERLCSPSEYAKTREGERAPNSRETWLDCQARALGQAATLIATVLKEGSK